MTNVLIGLVAIVLLVGLVLIGIYFMGDELQSTTLDAKAAQIVNEGSQIKNAYDFRLSTTGQGLDLRATEDELIRLRDEVYLKVIPPGMRANWDLNQTGVALTPIGVDSTSRRICVRVRERVGIPDPDNVLACDDPSITDRDPCCFSQE